MAHGRRHCGVMMGQSRPGLSGEMAGMVVIPRAAPRCDRTVTGHLYVLLPPPTLSSRLRYLRCCRWSAGLTRLDLARPGSGWLMEI